ncbi:MAG: ferric reductase-like transmembrane domain-containing protein [Thermoleophilia bacterium]|nr:ferric reductase-like transmembrane domain-containing protein [Thermoleophilia bacterium]
MKESIDLLEWYFIRASGATTLLLLTAAIALGVATHGRWSPENRPRWVTRELHRNIGILAMVFTTMHVLTSVIQSHANVSLGNVLVPLAGTSHSLALALGTVAVDLFVAIGITSALRRRIGVRAWRAVHYSSWALWPVAALHGLTMGTDAWSWMLIVNGLCLSMFIGALWIRLEQRWPDPQPPTPPGRRQPPPSARFDVHPHVPGMR